MDSIDIIREITANAQHKYDSVNKIKVKMIECAKLHENEYMCDYNLVHREVINSLREEKFKISLHSNGRKMYYVIRW